MPASGSVRRGADVIVLAIIIRRTVGTVGKNLKIDAILTAVVLHFIIMT